MSFEALSQSAEKLRDILYNSTGMHLITQVSVEPPGERRGEASFIKLVLWSYALWFEASQPTGRYLMNIVRNSSPEDHKSASRAILDVQHLRTFYTHNLLPSNKNDEYKYNQAKAWLAKNGASSQDWDSCTAGLCSSLTTALNVLYNHWNRVTTSPEDAATAIKTLIEALEREWEPHLFDSIVEEVATSIGLSDFDSVKYRGNRLDDWRKIPELFLDRSSAEVAVRRAILQEMSMKFGVASE